MSERVTFEVCPRCGSVAAVGWAPAPGADGAPGESRPVEFDCPAGCQISHEALATVYHLLRRLPAEETSPSGQGQEHGVIPPG